jgi:hypothetical protein
MATRPFRLLDLPPEIREQIYLYWVAPPSPDCYISLTPELSDPSQPPIHTHFPLSIILTCSQLRAEVIPLYFAINKFSILLTRSSGTSLSYFLSPDFAIYRRLITTLRLTIPRFGSHDFFLLHLQPTLSNMILTGSLRHLGVRLRRSNLLEFKCLDETERTLDHRCGPRRPAVNVGALLALRELCEDEDLESSEVKVFDEPRCWVVEKGEEKGLRDVSYVLRPRRKLFRPKREDFFLQSLPD